MYVHIKLDCIDLHIFAPPQSGSSTHNAHYEQHSLCHHTTQEETYCSGTIIYCGVSVCREAAVLSVSAQVTDTVYIGLRGINVKPWNVESGK